MIDVEQFRELHERRFPKLPLDCGNALDPGLVDEAEWRDWSSVETTPDQLRIEDYLDTFSLKGKRILHIGVGNSGLARRFAGRAYEIVGTTVVPAEADRGNALGLRNYRVVLHNKHGGQHGMIRGPFDFIVDNNPTTFCCCIKHLISMLEFYSSKLAANGQIVTDRVGLGWTTNAPGANPRWAFSFDDLAEAAAPSRLVAYRVSGWTYVLAFRSPNKPSFAGKLGHKLRSATRRASRKLNTLASRLNK